MKLISKPVTETIRQEIKDKIRTLDSKPNLTVIKVGDNKASETYVNNKIKACKQVDMSSSLIELPDNITQQELIGIINILNDSPKVHGLLVQLPLPKHIDEKVIASAISPLKDVDCFNAENVGLLNLGITRFAPCTPSGIITLLEYYNVALTGAYVVIIGRSNIVGKPLANLLINLGATVTICNSKTYHLKEITKQGDIVISAIGKPKYLDDSYFNENAIVVDVGINRDLDNKLCGDVDFDKVCNKVKAITPVPGGVGPMTINQLLINTLNAYLLNTSNM